MPVDAVLVALGDSAVAYALRSGLYPLGRSSHLLGVCLLIGPIVVADLRILLGAATPSPQAVLALLRPAMVVGLVLAIVTGAALFSVQPQALWENPALRVKVLLIAAACLNALAFERSWSRSARVGTRIRLGAGYSLALWLCVLAVSSWIPYA